MKKPFKWITVFNNLNIAKKIAFIAILLLINTSALGQVQVNLNITKTANPTTAVPGQTVTWTVTLTNTTVANTGYNLSDAFPSGFIFNQGASNFPAGTPSFNLGTNTFTHAGTVPGNGTHVFTLVGTVNPAFNAPGTLNNTAVMNYNVPGITLPGKQASASIAVIRTSISGFKYNDLNGNGAFNAGEPRLPGWTIYLDANDNNILDSGEVSVVTNSVGEYVFNNLVPGTYIVREVQQPGWTQTQPGFGAAFKYTVTLNANNPTAARNFGNRELPSIRVTKWSDQDNSGSINAPDTRVPNWRFYIDANNNNQLDSGEIDALTNGNGDAYFISLSPGTYRIREVLTPGWQPVLPSVGYVDVLIAANDGQKTAEFLNVLPNRITGIKYHDINANGSRDGGEPVLFGWRIYVDLNNNGIYDAGEPSDITAGDGSYTINGVPIGNWIVREVVVGGWQVTQPSSGFYNVSFPTTGLIQNLDFGNTQLVRISGAKFFDRNSNGLLDADEPLLPNWDIFLDTNMNGTHDPGEPLTTTSASGTYEFIGLTPGTYRVYEIMKEGWYYTAPANGFHLVTLLSGEIAANRNFGNRLQDESDPFTPKDIVGNVWYDQIGLRRWDKPTEQPMPTVEVRLVGKSNTGAPVERFTFSNEDGVYRFTGLEFGEYTVSRIESDYLFAEYPRLDQESPNGHGHRISLVDGYVGIPHTDAVVIAGDKPNWLSDIVTPGSGGIFMGMFLDLDLNLDGVVDERVFASGAIEFEWSRASAFNGLNIGYDTMKLLGHSETLGDFEIKLRRFGRNDGTLIQHGDNPRVSLLDMRLLLEISFENEEWFGTDNQEIEMQGETFRWIPYGTRLNSAAGMSKQLFNVFGQQKARILGAEAHLLYGADFSLNRSRFGHVPEALYPVMSAETQSRAIDPFEYDWRNPVFFRTTFEQRFKVRNIQNPGPPALDQNQDEPAVVVPQSSRSGRDITLKVDTSGEGYLWAWIDMNKNGTWEPDENVINKAPLVVGTDRVETFTFKAPNTTVEGDYWVRLRLISNDVDAQPVGTYFGGDVRDVSVKIVLTGSSISGIAFRDTNGNNIPDEQDIILVGLTVFADSNGNRVLDDGEPFTITDQQGYYSLNLPGGGSYLIMPAFLPPRGYVFENVPISVTLADNEDKQMDLKLEYVIVSDNEDKPDVPKSVELHPNYPNPFNPTTTIGFSLPSTSHVKLAVYDVTGRMVRTVLNQIVQSGSHTVQFDASGLTSGLYLYRLEAAGIVITNKMTLIK
jgi:uncharacterized repeat protein (TIGR01451 family)